jgi:outer membrane lipoprotein SlyB
MAMLVWVMAGLAIWHFTVFLPDDFYGGIVGAFCGAVLGSIIFGIIVNAGSIPGRHDTDLITGVEAIPGAVLGLAVVWWMGKRQIRQQQATA